MARKSFKPFFHKLGIVFITVLPVILLLNILIPDKGFSENENRVLASFPEMSVSQMSSGRMASQFETYANDQFFLRDFWVTLKAGFDRLLLKVENNGVYLGKHGYLIESFKNPPEGRLNATLDAMTGFAARHPELHQFAVIAPNAVNILSYNLPAAAPTDDQDPYLTSVKNTLMNAGIVFIDLRDMLRSHTDQQLFYKTDHHWTTQAAYYAYLAMADPMMMDTSVLSYEKLPVTHSFQGTLSAKSGFRSGAKEDIFVFLPKGETPEFVVNYVTEQKKTGSYYATDRLNTRDKYAMFLDGNHSQIKISTPSAVGGTLMIIKDSYANCLIPFIAPHYKSVIVIDPRYYYGNLEQLIAAEGVDELLYVYNANTFFADTSLELALTAEENA